MARRLSDEEREQLRQLWRDHTVREIAEITGKTVSALQKYGIVHFGGFAGHSAETRRRIQELERGNWRAMWTPEARERHDNGVRETRRKERQRERWGLSPKTKWPRKLMRRAAYYARYRLISRCGYFSFNSEPYTLYYDKDTRRCLKRGNFPNTGEEYFARKYGFKFMEAEGDDE